MASPQKVLDMIRAGDDWDTVRIEIKVDAGGGGTWTNIYEDENITIGGSGDDLIFTADIGDIEYTNGAGQGTQQVSGIRIIALTALENVFPETTFTNIDVEQGATIRFTEIKLTLT